MHRLIENKGLGVYKRLLTVLGDYCSKFPATGVDKLLNAAANGKSVCPGDKHAMCILNNVLSGDSAPEAVSNLQNKRFADLPIGFRPVYQDGEKYRVAFWARDGKISDRVKALLDFEETGKSGNWSDVDGNSVTLLYVEGK